ncbi:hypothetical protein GsuE55_13120 [Geobacillus subterraneus]|uniref:Transcriptional coactivator p15 (PC4) C-terminal domain-containing protein n=1 Tax=Geobacillus subterraneus TaxID=129338 RepID=A0A679FND7_9BACL|nr:hypothetical protein B4113_2680 [Geobacillus sp. B4113_201601]BBW96479.1 hypothetical protein GsuE55_13120 [Geobacillus subterraneus]
MATIQFEIKKRIATLSSSPKGWNKELNLVSWNGYPPKYDIRDWDSSYTKMGRGVTLSEGEARNLYYALKRLFEKDPPENEDWREHINRWMENYPLFIQQIKNILVFMNEKEHPVEKQRELLAGIHLVSSEEALQYELEYMKNVYPSLYDEWVNLVRKLTVEDLERMLLYVRHC